MENLNFLIILLGIVLIVLLVISVFLGVLLFKMYKSPEKKLFENKNFEDMVDKINDLKKSSKSIKSPSIENKTHCSIHPENKIQTVCAICSIELCEDCVFEDDKHHFCQEHFHYFLENEWQNAVTIYSDAENSDPAIKLIKLKTDLWENEKFPAIISTHYKINIEKNKIESFVSMIVKKEDVETAREKIHTNSYAPTTHELEAEKSPVQ